VLVTDEGDTGWGGAAVLSLSNRTLSGLEKDVLFGRYTANGNLLVSRRDRTLLAAPFDLRSLRTSGSAVAVLREVAFGCNGAAAFAVSENGTLVYAAGYIRGSGMDLSRLARVSEKGDVELLPFDADTFGRVAMPSPDGRSLAVLTSEGSVWIYDLSRRIRRALPLGKGRGQGYAIAWSPDSRSVAYAASSEGSQGWGIYIQDADGSRAPEELVPPGEEGYALAIAPDGAVVCTEFAAKPKLWLRPPGGKGEARTLVDGFVAAASVSPDGKWLAYDFQDANGWQVSMRPLSGEGPRVLLAPGARFPRWSPDGKKVFCRQGDAIVRIPIPQGDRPEPGASEILFRMPMRGFSVAADGKGFFAVVDSGDSGIVRELHLVTNWFTELEALTSQAGSK
jgi:Tol biopolymer transport system component